ncbi:MAG: nucleotidyltransferase family protein [Candidatus Melainabacteria bacterium]|nr:MAG: nucleotidyltransferase family protein [Candidatus Melainabacteria bacterium]
MEHVIILCGGKGERLRPFTEDKPKCMIPVLGNPLLSLQIKLLSLHGFKKMTLCCGYKHELIQDYFGDGSSHSVQINYLIEETPLGRGGALKQALKHSSVPKDEPVLAMNGDIITNLALSSVVRYHRKHKPLATIVTVPLRCDYGIIEIDESMNVSAFREKPELPLWVNAGIYVLEPEIVDELPDKGDHEVGTFPLLAEQGLLKAYPTQSFWKAIDTAKDLNELRNDCEQLFLQSFLQTDFAPELTPSGK